MRSSILGIAAALLLAGAPVLPAAAAPQLVSLQNPVELTPSDRIMGKTDAPVTIVEYASMTCPHCAEFDETIFPEIKKNYIDTGKARYVFRDFPLDQLAVKGAVLARCAPPERFFGFIDVLFRNQAAWVTASDPMVPLARFAKLGGMSDEQFNKCMADTALADQVLGQRLEGAQKFDIDATPTIIINGRKVQDARTYADYDRLLSQAAGS